MLSWHPHYDSHLVTLVSGWGEWSRAPASRWHDGHSGREEVWPAGPADPGQDPVWCCHSLTQPKTVPSKERGNLLLTEGLAQMAGFAWSLKKISLNGRAWENWYAFFQACKVWETFFSPPRSWKVWEFHDNGQRLICRRAIQKKTKKWRLSNGWWKENTKFA